MIRTLTFLIILLALAMPLTAQPVVLNEVMASNSYTLPDEDGEFPDWLELFNAGPAPVNLAGYGLSDDPDEPFQWVFPQLVLGPQQHLVVFASDKDRTDAPAHWETVVWPENDWRYFVGGTEPPADWATVDFDASIWPTGPAGFGYGDGDDATEVSSTLSVYVRQTFTIDDVADLTHLWLHVDFDDGFVAYLNDVEIARAMMGEPGSRPPHDQTAYEQHEAQMYQGGAPEAFPIPDFADFLQPGQNVLAIQVHNVSASSSDLSLIPFLTAGMNTPPAEPAGAHPLLVDLLPRLHTNFKISADGEWLTLTEPDGQISDQFYTDAIPGDIARGRQPDGAPDWFYFETATPGEPNTGPVYQGVAPAPIFSPTGGFYDGTVMVELSGSNETGTIYYTLNGDVPDENSAAYTTPFAVNQTAAVRARVLAPNYLPGPTASQTYFVDTDHDLSVISLSTAPANFFDPDSGIYVMGPNAEPEIPHFGANFWQDWERPINVELYEPDGSQAFNIPAGVKIFGGWSRANPQKSLSIFARNRYGVGEIEYPIFPDQDIDTYYSFILRNSGNDWMATHFRDGLMTGLLDGVDVERQAFRPAVVYLNGLYWGILNMREKVNEEFIATHHPGVDPDNIDELEGYMQVIEGDEEHYAAMIDYIGSHDLAVPAYLDYVGTQMELDNYIEYCIAQIYFDNTDWPGNNIKYWRPRTADGRWRWILFDTDFGFGMYDSNAYTNNTLAFALEPNGPNWPNPPWSTFLLRSLMENEAFRNEFITRFADRLNTIFRASRVIEQIDQIAATITPEIPPHFNRWERNPNGWWAQVQRLRDFATYRVANVRNHIVQEFDLSGMILVALDIEGEGHIQLNTIRPETYPWGGYYFQNIPIELTAVPAPGYDFVEWSGSALSEQQTITLTSSADVSVTAHFAPADDPNATLVINEINYNSADDVNPEDWIEFYNNSSDIIDLSGWTFSDEDNAHVFPFPTGLLVEPGQYFVVCENLAAFSDIFPEVENAIGDLGFGLSGGGELLRLFNPNGTLVDSVLYDDEAPWPVAPDGTGPTLALLNPDLDNALPSSWQASGGYGTPGDINDVYTRIEDESAIDGAPNMILQQNYPNPWFLSPAKGKSSTRIAFSLPSKQAVTLRVYNTAGQLVKTLLDGTHPTPAGTHEVTWDGRNEHGLPVSSGVYFYRLEASATGHETMVQTRRMVLLR